MALVIIDTLGESEEVVISEKKKEETKTKHIDFEYVEPQLQIIENV